MLLCMYLFRHSCHDKLCVNTLHSHMGIVDICKSDSIGVETLMTLEQVNKHEAWPVIRLCADNCVGCTARNERLCDNGRGSHIDRVLNLHSGQHHQTKFMSSGKTANPPEHVDN